MNEFSDVPDVFVCDEPNWQDVYDDETWIEHREAVEIEQQDRLIRVGDQEGDRT